MSKSKADKSRLDAIHRIPCVCCASMKVEQPFQTECHHIVTNGYRRLSGGHQSTIPLDAWHHRGLCLDGWSSSEMAKAYGPSLALSKRSFIITFGTELQLLEQTNRLLESITGE